MKALNQLETRAAYFVVNNKDGLCNLFFVESVSAAGVEGFWYGTKDRRIAYAKFLPLYCDPKTDLFCLKERGVVLDKGYVLRRKYWGLEEFLRARSRVPMAKVGLTGEGQLGTKSLTRFRNLSPKVRHHYF